MADLSAGRFLYFSFRLDGGLVRLVIVEMHLFKSKEKNLVHYVTCITFGRLPYFEVMTYVRCSLMRLRKLVLRIRSSSLGTLLCRTTFICLRIRSSST